MHGGNEQSAMCSNNQSVHWRFQIFRLYGLALQAILQQAAGVFESNLLITDWSLVRNPAGPTYLHNLAILHYAMLLSCKQINARLTAVARITLCEGTRSTTEVSNPDENVQLAKSAY